MPLNFRPFRGLIVFLLLGGLVSPLVADRKNKSAAAEVRSKTKNTLTQKTDPKQQAKAGSRKEKEDRTKLAKKAEESKNQKNRGKQVEKLAAKQGTGKSTDKLRGKETLARREAEKKNEKTKDRLARREEEKKTGRKKEDALAKKTLPEKDTKQAKVAKESELATTKAKLAAKNASSETKAPAKSAPSDKKRDGAGQEKNSTNSRLTVSSARNSSYPGEEKIKELPSSKFTLRPVAKVASKVELKFSIARAAAITSFDPPPPRDNGPDVIDVIEHDSPETTRLDALFRSEMKSVQYSSAPSISHKKLDVGKMDEERIKQIQEALTRKGYYSGEISGQYDNATIEAMRRFQQEHKIDVTGYATAQSLRLLGLTDW